MDIISYIQASKAKKEVQDLNKILGAGDLYKSGQLPVEDIFDTVRERVENLESISPSGIMLTEINQEIEEAHMKAVVELAETVNEVKASTEDMEVIKHYKFPEDISSDSENISYQEDKLGLVFGEFGEAHFNLPKDNLIKLTAFSVASKEKEEVESVSLIPGSNLVQMDGGYTLLDKSLPAELESDLITLSQKEDIYLTKDVELEVEVLYSTHEDFSEFIKVKYSPLLERVVVEPESSEEDEESEEGELEIELVFGEYLDKLPYGVTEFKVKVVLNPIEKLIPEPEPELPEEPEHPEEEEIELLSEEESKEDIQWDNYVLKIKDLKYVNLIPVESTFIFNEREFKEGTLLPVYEAESAEDLIKVKLEDGEILHSLTISWIER